MESRSRKKSIITRIFFIACLVYVAVSLISLQMEITSRQDELDMVTAQIEAERVRTTDLERQLDMGDNEAYLTRIAHEKLEMGYPDEHVYRDTSGS